MQLCYISKENYKMRAIDISNILSQARKNNEKNNITGILIYFDGIFVQVLEGEEDKLNKLFDVISNDTRHSPVVTIFKRTIAKKQFDQWDMGYVHQEDIDKLKDNTIFEFFEQLKNSLNDQNAEMTNLSPTAILIIDKFKSKLFNEYRM